MPNVYIVGATLPAGGAYMAYHVGRLLALHFGYTPVDVQVAPEVRPVFTYDMVLPATTMHMLEEQMQSDDLLIANPSFSQYLLGWRLPGRKIMYAQGFQTFKALDCQFDLYVSVSGLVQRYLHTLYGIDSPIIPAFAEPESFPELLPWPSRPVGSVLVYLKDYDLAHQLVYRELKRALPDYDLSNVMQGKSVGREEFLQRIGAVRYFVNLSLAEGFGLPALEAMGMGTMVTGLDGLAGPDYMKSGENCLVASVKDLRELCPTVGKALADPALALRCVTEGFKTAQAYDYAAFKRAWLSILSDFLGTAPDAA